MKKILLMMALFLGACLSSSAAEQAQQSITPASANQTYNIQVAEMTSQESVWFQLYTRTPYLTLTAYAPSGLSWKPLQVSGIDGQNAALSGTLYTGSDFNNLPQLTLTQKRNSYDDYYWNITVSLIPGVGYNFKDLFIYAEFED